MIGRARDDKEINIRLMDRTAESKSYMIRRREELTKMRPVVVCPEMSSPAQSLASVTKVPSNSSLACRGGLGKFCCCCFKSLWLYSGDASFRQQIIDKARHKRTISRPARKVKMLDRRKHHHFRSLRHSISSGE